MAFLKVETKNKVDIDKKPRVYFTCHPDDFEKHFKKICDDIFKTHDCAIYYTEDMTEVVAEDEKQVDLGRNNLFVVPVTFKLLTTPNRAMDEDIPYALKEHIPVLPIVMEPGIDEFYSKPDKFGELQYLNPYSTDLTEICYEEKLKKYLESVLISDELAKRVRTAFDAYIFLSYRKKDRKYANELMRLIHSNPECRDIAIWFDEFLTPGESFKENIEKILDDCKLFTLLVTPQLLEKVVDKSGEERDNYVISTELPLARKKKQEKGTDIFAVEMEDTDKEALSAISIEDYTNPKNADFRARLLEIISRMAITTNNTPEHNFLIGLAYLEGVDMEVDRERGLELITYAAEAELPEAMEKLYEMYSKGFGVEIDYQEAVKWAGRLVDYNKREFGEKDARTIRALNVLSLAHIDNGDYTLALIIGDRVCTLSMECFGENSIEYLTYLLNLGMEYYYLEDPEKALNFCEKAYKNGCNLLKNEEPLMLPILNGMALALDGVGKRRRALKMVRQTYELSCEILGEENPDTLIYLNNLAASYASLGKLLMAAKTLEKVCALKIKALGEEHPCTLFSLANLAVIYLRLCRGKKALRISEIVYETTSKALKENHPSTRRSLRILYLAYGLTGNFKLAMQYYTQYITTPSFETEVNSDQLKYNNTRKKRITEKLIDKLNKYN